MTDKHYTCPQCEGRVVTDMGEEWVCEDCGLNVTEVLSHLAKNEGPLSDIAIQLHEIMHDDVTSRAESSGIDNKRSAINWES